VVAEGLAYAAWGVEGIGVHDGATGATLALLMPPDGLGQVDDLAASDGLLFALDARRGRLVVLGLDDPEAPAQLGRARAVHVGPFSGVSAGGGHVVVSGGTGRLTRLSYDVDGRLSGRGTVDLGLGQPDVLVDPGGEVAYVSTDFDDAVDGAGYGITTLPLAGRLVAADQLGLEGSGFTGGVTGPANFPVECAVAGERLYVAFGGGLAVVDVSGPTLSLLTTVALPMDGLGVDVFGDRAWVVGSSPEPTVVVLSLDAPDAPEVPAEIAIDGTPRGVAAIEGGALVGAGEAGVRWVAR
jgi:hypothetical protein